LLSVSVPCGHESVPVVRARASNGLFIVCQPTKYYCKQRQIQQFGMGVMDLRCPAFLPLLCLCAFHCMCPPLLFLLLQLRRHKSRSGVSRRAVTSSTATWDAAPAAVNLVRYSLKI